jgi:hypothetical protein
MMVKKRKKKAKPKDNGEMFLTPELLHELLLADAEAKNASLVLKVADLSWKETQREHLQKRLALEKAVQVQKAAYQQVTKKVGKKYNIDMKEYAYDTETGRLNHTGE